MSHESYIRRETLVSMVINGVLSLVFFLLVFGFAQHIPVWGMGNFVFDFIPQSFMISLMSTLVPGALTAKRLGAGALSPSDRPSRLPRSLILRALLLAILSAIVGTAIVAALATASGVAQVEWSAALALKIVYGVILGAFVTPIGLRAALAGR